MAQQEKKDIDAKEALGAGSKDPAPEQPTTDEMQEAATPELSTDEFVLGERTFKIRISNIRTQKIMAKALDAITDLIKKIDLKPVFNGLQERMNRDRKKLADRMAASLKTDGKKKDQEVDYEEVIRNMAEEDESSYVDMVELIKDIITHGGISNIMVTLLDIYAGVVFAICNSQDKNITKDWVEDELSFSVAQDVFFRQMEKDRIGGKVIDFLYVATQQVIRED